MDLFKVKRKPSWIFAGICALFLWGIASIPGNTLQGIQLTPQASMLRLALSDPFMHALTAALLTLAIVHGFRVSPLKAGLLAAGYGLCIELYQLLLPWRTFGLDDLVWHLVGVVLSLALLSALTDGGGEPKGKTDP